LFCRKQVGQRIDHVPLDRPLQVPRAVALVGSLLQKKIAARVRYAKQKLAFGGFQYALLHLAQLNLQNLFQLFSPQRMKHHHFVQTVHEFGGKLAPRSFDSRALHLLINPSSRLVLRLNEAHSALH
jgi:hypothetical protein